MSSGITLQTGIEDVIGAIEAEELEQVILVGHSAGAATALGVADRIAARLRQLVFLDGLLLQHGESLRTHFTPPQEALFQAASRAGGLPFPPPPADVFGLPQGPDADWVNRRLTPLPFGTAGSPLHLRNPVGNGLPCTYIACNAPVHPFVATSHQFAQSKAGWVWREISDGHEAMITAPGTVAETLLNMS